MAAKGDLVFILNFATLAIVSGFYITVQAALTRTVTYQARSFGSIESMQNIMILYLIRPV